MVFAVLTGAGTFQAIADRAVELPPELLAVAAPVLAEPPVGAGWAVAGQSALTANRRSTTATCTCPT